MPLTTPNAYELQARANETARRALADLARLQDTRQRNLAVLRNTFPDWTIRYVRSESGFWIWEATLRALATVEMIAAGVRQTVKRRDVIALMTALADQMALLQQFRSD